MDLREIRKWLADLADNHSPKLGHTPMETYCDLLSEIRDIVKAIDANRILRYVCDDCARNHYGEMAIDHIWVEDKKVLCSECYTIYRNRLIVEAAKVLEAAK